MMKKYAILIGNGHFASNSGLRPLEYTQHDVFRLEAVLKPSYDDVIPVINQKRLNILSKIEDVVAKLQPGDLLLIYYSGHGETLADEKLYLAASNTLKSRLAATALRYDDILTVLEHFYLGTTMIILDCCYSGMAGVNAKGETEAPALGYGVELASGMCLITASSAHQVAKEQERYHGGTFTHYLLEGLKSGVSSHYQDGIIRPHELYEYVFEKVKAEGHEQTPLIKSNIQGVLPFFTRDLIKPDPLDALKNRLLYAHETKELKQILNELTNYLKQNSTSVEGVKLKKNLEKRVLDQTEPAESSAGHVAKTQKHSETEKKQTKNQPSHHVKPTKNQPEHTMSDPLPKESRVEKPKRKIPLKFIIPSVVSLAVMIVFLERAWFDNGTSAVESSDFPYMVFIKGGTFEMGCQPSDTNCYRNENPLHSVTVKDFYLSTTEVTFEQYDHYCNQVSSCDLPDDEGWGRGQRPVINVSWKDAQKYIQWLNEQTGQQGYRLPTEAQWEYAARAGSTTKYSWGNDIGKNNADCYACGSRWDNRKTAEVASFAPNSWGLYDMHGNVQEWCEDRWHSDYTGAPIDGSAWVAGDDDARVLRGGSWLNIPWNLRSSNRLGRTPSELYYFVGFRVAQVL